MSDDNGQRAEMHWQDAFTSPSWQIPELDEAVLAPPLEDFGLTDFRAPRDLPKPPDVDQILRGEYTGWVPVIREGESLAQAEERQQALVSPVVEEVVHVVEVQQQPEMSQPVESLKQPSASSPWLAVETFEYGYQAHHEVPTAPQSTPVVEPTAGVEPTPVVQPDGFHDTFDTTAWNSSNSETNQSAPQATQSIDATIVAESASPTDHSLELVIMRDEIQDLRNRLDASQKLVEEMMHKLANLAELALRSRM